MLISLTLISPHHLAPKAYSVYHLLLSNLYKIISFFNYHPYYIFIYFLIYFFLIFPFNNWLLSVGLQVHLTFFHKNSYIFIFYHQVLIHPYLFLLLGVAYVRWILDCLLWIWVKWKEITLWTFEFQAQIYQSIRKWKLLKSLQ